MHNVKTRRGPPKSNLEMSAASLGLIRTSLRLRGFSRLKCAFKENSQGRNFDNLQAVIFCSAYRTIFNKSSLEHI